MGLEYGTENNADGVFHFVLGPSFWAAARSKAEEIVDKGGDLEFFEDMEPVVRSFAVRGDAESVNEMLRHVRKITAH